MVLAFRDYSDPLALLAFLLLQLLNLQPHETFAIQLFHSLKKDCQINMGGDAME